MFQGWLSHLLAPLSDQPGHHSDQPGHHSDQPGHHSDKPGLHSDLPGRRCNRPGLMEGRVQQGPKLRVKDLPERLVQGNELSVHLDLPSPSAQGLRDLSVLVRFQDLASKLRWGGWL